MTEELRKEFDSKFTYVTHHNIEDIRNWIDKNFTPKVELHDKIPHELDVNAKITKDELQEIFNVLASAKNELRFQSSNYDKHPSISIVEDIRKLEKKHSNFSL